MNQSHTRQQHRIRNILVVGGGTAGWMTAASLVKNLGADHCNITLVESDQIGTVGVGEATIPNIHLYNESLGINEGDFLKKTQGTFKLGIEFVNWGKLGQRYMHPFGPLGTNIGAVPFYHYWQKYHQLGLTEHPGDYSIGYQAAMLGRFMRPTPTPNSPLGDITYAYHFDAGLYARYLRDYAEARGVHRHEGEVVEVALDESSGHIASLLLKSGERLQAELFIDCSGFSALLLGKTLGVEFEDWSQWLACDSAVTVPSANIVEPPPYTRATAQPAGWQWKIPLQHRTGNGHVYSSAHMDDKRAQEILLDSLEEKPLAEPRLIKFKPGVRKQNWHRNCVAIGLSGGFLEPLESTSIYLIQAGISRLLTHFPSALFEQTNIDRYNKLTYDEYVSIRDFIILHYKLTQRDDSSFWRFCRDMEIPDSLNQILLSYQAEGRFDRGEGRLFSETSWLAVLHGQGLVARDYHPLADLMNDEEFRRLMPQLRAYIHQAAQSMPSHADYLARLSNP